MGICHHIFYINFKHMTINLLKSIAGETPSLEKALAGEELSYRDGVQLLKEENLFLLGLVADKIRKNLKGNTVTFVSSYYLNYTNVCAPVVLCVHFTEKAMNPMLIP